MEEDLLHHVASPLASTKAMAKVEEKLKRAIEVASERQDYESAHDPELQRALQIVSDFIVRKKRVCYGGTAMNAILPETMRFYNPERDLPDYDFYTPAISEDVAELVADLRGAGFKEVYHKIGMHEGTKKILVNFTPVADISHIEPDLFAILYRRSIQVGGIHYTDPDILRMMMYLEMSRPKGEVARWEKVFERLQLINRAFPIRSIAAGSWGGGGAGAKPSIPFPVRKFILNYVIENQRILCNGPIAALYKRGIRRRDATFAIRPGGAVLLTSPDPKGDGVALKEGLKPFAEDVRLYLHRARGEIVPERIELRMGNRPICLIVKEVACHSFNRVPVEEGGRSLCVGSLEFLITLYLSLDIFTNHSKDVLGERAVCDVAMFLDLAKENYLAKRSQFPAFSLSCRGHQTGFVSLLRAKVARIKAEKEGRGSSRSRSGSGSRKRSAPGTRRLPRGDKKKKD
jgi:hypothetical protein